MFRRLLATNSDTAQLILRLVLGLVILPHGMQKMFGAFGGYGFSNTMDYFTNQAGIPALFAFLAITAEFFGALGLITGLLSRIAAFGISVVMVVATLTVHWSNGFFMNWNGNQPGEGFEYHLLAVGLALAVMINGGGKWSLDGLIARKIAAGRGVRVATSPHIAAVK